LYPDASAGSVQTVSGNACFDGNPTPNDGVGGHWQHYNWGKVQPIGPLEVTFVHDENCDEQPDRPDGISTCYCGGVAGHSDDNCNGHDSTERNHGKEYTSGTYVNVNPASGYPRKSSYFKAKNIYDQNCKSVTKTINSNGLCSQMGVAYTKDRVACTGNNTELRYTSQYGHTNVDTHYQRQFCTYPGNASNSADYSTKGDGQNCIEWDFFNHVEITNPQEKQGFQFHMNPNKKVNFHYGNYECGMRERVLVFGPTGNYCPYGQE
jgi:hypothetical protein